MVTTLLQVPVDCRYSSLFSQESAYPSCIVTRQGKEETRGQRERERDTIFAGKKKEIDILVVSSMNVYCISKYILGFRDSCKSRIFISAME